VTYFRALDAGMSVGLGSDIAGGYSLSIQQSMRQAVITSRLREAQRQESTQINGTDPSETSTSLRVDWMESLYVATRGGKAPLGLGGCFEVGMEFDAQLSELEIRD
jgi:guanine deaminase